MVLRWCKQCAKETEQWVKLAGYVCDVCKTFEPKDLTTGPKSKKE